MKNNLIYIATRGDDAGMARWRSFMARAAQLGLEASYDWTRNIDESRAAGWLRDSDVPMSRRHEIAKLELRAIVRSRFFVYLVPPDKSEGAACELGMAIAAAKVLADLLLADLPGWPCVIVVGPARTFFATLADHHFDTDDDAIAFLARQTKL